MPRHPFPSSRAWLGCAVAGSLLLGACDGLTGPSTDPPSITTAELPDGVVAEPYSAGVTATGGEGTLSWDIGSGSLPTGLALSREDLEEGDDIVITGTPENDGTFSFVLRVEDEAGRTDTARLEIDIAPPPQDVALETPRIPPALVGSVYEVILEASGGDHENFAWSVVDGSLPAGLELGDDGQFSGTPTAPDTATFTVRVSSGGTTDETTFTLPVVPNNTARFDITTFPVVPVPSSLEDNVREAVRRWEAAITGDLSRIPIAAEGQGSFGPNACGGFGSLVNGTAVDDIMILVNIDSIDGVGDILAQAGPCAIRNSNDLPAVGLLTLDRDDLERFATQETVTDIIQHEIAHVLGFGALWDTFALLQGARTNDPRYTGEQAVQEYQDAGGTSDSVPVEAEGGEGTRDSHWRESVFGDELLTGFSAPDGVDMHLSRMSIASMADLGFEVDLSAADDEPLIGLRAHADQGRPHLGYDIVGVGPILVLDDHGHPKSTLDQ